MVFVIRPESVAEHGGALAAQLVVAALFKRNFAPAFEQHDAEAGPRKNKCHHAAPGARADDDGIDGIELHLAPAFAAACSLCWPPVITSSMRSIFQDACCQLPPCSGEPK